MKQRHLLILVLLFLASCTPAPRQVDENGTQPPDAIVTNPTDETMPTNDPLVAPLDPKDGDGKLERGNVFIEEKGLLIRESYPPQIALSLQGNLPTPCHYLRVNINKPDPENRINIEVYTVVDPNMLCTQVLKPFQETVELGTFPSGHYSVFVNDELVGEFDS